MGKLRTIYLALLNRREKIARKRDILMLIEEYNKNLGKISVKNALWYLSRYNYIKRVFLDYYYINSIEERENNICKYEERELLFEVLNKEKIKWYLGLSSALYESGEIWQVPVVLTIINNKISGNRRILGRNVRFIKIKESLIFGLISKKTENKTTFFFSNPEKTNLDFAYFKISRKFSKNKKIKEYAKKYPKWIIKLI
jgi:hypothetical protein